MGATKKETRKIERLKKSRAWPLELAGLTLKEENTQRSEGMSIPICEIHPFLDNPFPDLIFLSMPVIAIPKRGGALEDGGSEDLGGLIFL